MIEQELRIHSRFGALVPSEVVSKALEFLLPAARSSTILAIQGSGGYRRPPQWLRNASDIRFGRGEPDNGALLLTLSVPTFGEAIPEIISQDDFWRRPVPPEFTALNLLEKTINDVAQGRRDSDLVDTHVLSKLIEFTKIPSFSDTQITLNDLRTEHPKGAAIDLSLTESANKIREDIPPPREAIVVGTLDMIKASTKSFAILLESGAELRGIFEGDPEELKELFRKKVVVAGSLYYKPSKSPLRIDAHSIMEADEISSMWEKLPEADVSLVAQLPSQLPQAKKPAVSSIFGSWPGDESDREVDRLLSELS